MRVLWVATKAPWPPVDGGRLLLWNTLRALGQAGVPVTLVAPYLGDAVGLGDCRAGLRDVCRPILTPSRLAAAPLDLLRSELRRRPWTLVRHENAEVERRLVNELEETVYDVVVAEQVQALAQVPTRQGSGRPMPPLVLRAQNVESDLWRGQGALASTPALLRWWLLRQAARLATAEGRAVARCAATAALTEHDARRLRDLARRVEPAAPCRVEVIAAAVDVELPAGRELVGEPALVLFGSAGWRPNVEGVRSFFEDAWPSIRERHPGAVLHLFGDSLRSEVAGDARIRIHPAPDDSATALAEGSILLVPLDVASGVRMKILEAWARGVAVVASPVAARGLVAESGRELEVVEEPDAWADATARCIDRADELRRSARRRLRRTYSADVVARRWLELFTGLSRMLSRGSPDGVCAGP